jgi:predicted nucleic acid-binding Zn ribbon protein
MLKLEKLLKGGTTMFRRDVQPLGDILQQFLRNEGLETPLLQKRIVDSWEAVVGDAVKHYTKEKFIKNQVLYVKIQNPALRQNLSMRRSQLTVELNKVVGTSVITDVVVY